jgi:thiol-disulfide isomerase/thioredoxin
MSNRRLIGADMNRRHKRFSRLFGLAVVAMVALVACSSAVTTSPVVEVENSQLPADFQVAVYQGEEVLGGEEVKFSELLDLGSPVVLNMWAGLCPPCRLEMPDFQEVHDEFAGQVLLFGLDVGPFTSLGSQDDGRALIQELGVAYPAGTTSDVEVVKAYKLVGMPTTYFIRPNGEIVRQWTGLLTKEKLTELVEELLEASNSS